MMRTWFLMLTGLMAAAPAWAAALDARWDACGVLESLSDGDTVLLRNGHVYVAGAGWKGGANQTSAVDVRRVEDAGVTTWTGALWSADCEVAFTQKVRAEGARIRVDVQVEAKRPFEAAAVMWRGFLPVAQSAGWRWVIVTTDEVRAAALPEVKAEPRILAGASAPGWFGWLGEKTGLRVAGVDEGMARVQVQDDREFGGSDFEFQAYAAAPGTLQPGRPVRLSFALEAVTPAILAAEEEKMRKSHVSYRGEGPLAVRAVTPARTEVPRYEKLDLRLDLSATYDNPFDPEEIDVTAEFRAPSGKTLRVPGFLYRPYIRSLQGNAARLSPQGPPEWRVRFAPVEVGDYMCRITVRDRTGRAESGPVRFRAVPGKRPGFVRISKDDPRYFEFDDRTPYFAIGANVCWSGPAGTYDYDKWFANYAAAGCNYARLWIGPFDLFTLERKPAAGQEDAGLGRYHQESAWNLDYVLDLAERHGLYLMYCIDSFNSLRIKQPYPAYQSNPYSVENGGMLKSPEEFFTNEAARKAFRNRLRYLVARWGYSPYVLSWEFWNEVDIIEKYVSADVRAWHAEMSRALREMDPWKHIQTTSFAGSGGDATVDGLPEMDYVQTHIYGPRDMAAGLTGWSRRKRDALRKPHFVGEFGIGGDNSERVKDKPGVCLHNGIWAPVMAGDAGVGMLWWWDSYIEPLNLYGHFAAFSAFAKGIDWPRERFEPAADATVAFAARPERPDLTDVVLEGSQTSWSASPANGPNTFTVPRSGKVEGMERLSGIQHGTRNHPALHNPATFEVEYLGPGRFVVQVRGVSGHGGAALKVTLDGRTLVEKEFADPDGQEKTDTLNQFNGPYPIDVPAGKHTVVVENTGNDWFYASYQLPGYAENWDPRLRAFALVGEKTALAWVQHTDHTWSKRADGIVARPVTGAVLRLPGVKPGEYRVETWDTYEGKVTKTETLRADGKGLSIPLPPIERDVALKVVRSR